MGEQNGEQDVRVNERIVTRTEKYIGVGLCAAGLGLLNYVIDDIFRSILLSIGIILISIGFAFFTGKTPKEYCKGIAYRIAIFSIILYAHLKKNTDEKKNDDAAD